MLYLLKTTFVRKRMLLMKKIAFLAVVVLLASLLLLSSCTYYDIPDGYSKEHHTYTEVLANIKKIDENATLEITSVDSKDQDGHDYREWSAIIRGLSCHAGSVTDFLLSDGFGSDNYARPYFVIKTDYDWYLMKSIIESDHPSFSMKSDDVFSRYNDFATVIVSSSAEELDDEKIHTIVDELRILDKSFSERKIYKSPAFSFTVSKEGSDSDIILKDLSESGIAAFINDYHNFFKN